MAMSGRYRHKVEWIQPDGSSAGTTRAYVKGVNAREAEIAGLDTGVIGLTIRIRQSENSIRPTTRWKANHGERQYNIAGSFDPTGKGRELNVIAVEGV